MDKLRIAPLARQHEHCTSQTWAFIQNFEPLPQSWNVEIHGNSAKIGLKRKLQRWIKMSTVAGADQISATRHEQTHQLFLIFFFMASSRLKFFFDKTCISNEYPMNFADFAARHVYPPVGWWKIRWDRNQARTVQLLCNCCATAIAAIAIACGKSKLQGQWWPFLGFLSPDI